MNQLQCLKDICEALYYTEIGTTEVNPYVIIPVVRTKIFDFEYPIFDTNYKANLETMFLKKYYTRDICCVEYWRWKMFLDSALHEIMPYYNELYKTLTLELNPLYNFTVDVSHEDSGGDTLDTTQKRDNDLTRGESKQNDNIRVDGGQDKMNSSTVTDSLNKFSDTPQGSLTGLTDGTYLTEATADKSTVTGQATTLYGKSINDKLKQIITGKDTSREEMTKNQSITTTRKYIESVSGRRDASDAELLIKYRETFIRIDEMLLNELNDCFSLVY